MFFMLFVGVDSENKTVVFAQGFFSNELGDSFEWALKHYFAVCGGHPEVGLHFIANIFFSDLPCVVSHLF